MSEEEERRGKKRKTMTEKEEKREEKKRGKEEKKELCELRVRKGKEKEKEEQVQVEVQVLQIFEGNRLLLADRSASFVALPLSPLLLNPFPVANETLLILASLSNKSIQIHEILHRYPPQAPQSLQDLPLESAGAIIRAKDTGKLLCIRDYHSPSFMDVQFKLRAAFTGRIDRLPTEVMLREIDRWTDDEISWIVEWKLQRIYPYATEQTIHGWKPAMVKLDPQIKIIYRAAKVELERRRKEGIRGPEHGGWGFPKGGAKVIGDRLETPAESAVRELKEEVNLEVAVKELDQAPHFDVPRDHGASFDRFFLHEIPTQVEITPPTWEVAQVVWRSIEELRQHERYSRFKDVFSKLEEIAST